MNTYDIDNTEEIVDNWEYPINIHDEDNLYKLLKVLASQNKRLDVEIDELYKNRFLETATGRELEKIGQLVGVIRKTGEGDRKLRTRIRAGFAASASDSTYDSFASAAISILDASPETITFRTPPETNPKVIEVEIDSSVFDNTPLTEEEIIVLLNGAISVDARVQIGQSGTFAFEGDDESLKGFNDGTWSVYVR